MIKLCLICLISILNSSIFLCKTKFLVLNVYVLLFLFYYKIEHFINCKYYYDSKTFLVSEHIKQGTGKRECRPSAKEYKENYFGF